MGVQNSLAVGMDGLNEVINLEKATGVPDKKTHKYYFNGTMGMAAIIYVKGVGEWNDNYETTEVISLTGAKTGSVTLKYLCNKDPWIISGVNCVLKNVADNTAIAWTKYFSQRPMGASGQWLQLASQMSANAPTPPPPPPPPANPQQGKPVFAPLLHSGLLQPADKTSKQPTMATGIHNFNELAAPDLSVASVNTRIVQSCDPKKPVAYAVVRVNNIGKKAFPATRSSQLRVFEKNIKARVNGGIKIPKIAAGKGVNLNIPLFATKSLSILSGLHTLTIKAEIQQGILEKSPTNNVIMKSLTFPKGYCNSKNQTFSGKLKIFNNSVNTQTKGLKQ